MKKYLNILSAIILGVSCLTFLATARGQLDNTGNANIPKIISPEDAAKKYPLPAGKQYPPASPLPTSSGGYYRSPYSTQIYDCTNKHCTGCPKCGRGALVLDEAANKVFRIP